MIEVQKNNPLHGIKLEVLLTELVDHYGWEVLADAMNLNCFKSNPSIKSSLKFLRKTLWAREKVEGFYLYKYKRLPKPDDVQYELPPRDRTVPLDQKPREPAVITVREKTEEERAPKPRGKPTGYQGNKDKPRGGDAPRSPKPAPDNVWGKWSKKD